MFAMLGHLGISPMVHAIFASGSHGSPKASERVVSGDHGHRYKDTLSVDWALPPHVSYIELAVFVANRSC